MSIDVTAAISKEKQEGAVLSGIGGFNRAILKHAKTQEKSILPDRNGNHLPSVFIHIGLLVGSVEHTSNCFLLHDVCCISKCYTFITLGTIDLNFFITIDFLFKSPIVAICFISITHFVYVIIYYCYIVNSPFAG